ncbi:MAG: hypothetical protein LBD10_12060 [Desulfobulbus sp.]|uniref:hypothetical protein n=1 Tax=Desulfobulbus sp. TaxID=895 RepID=UPI00284646E7|nr:hypothetical protein [Desulfobulbus sp.]MDR2550922.1 hypothetical protein [Desulfobulbus sp.]
MDDELPASCRQVQRFLRDNGLDCRVRMWASAGTADSLFEIATEELIRLAGGRVADIAG